MVTINVSFINTYTHLPFFLGLKMKKKKITMYIIAQYNKKELILFQNSISLILVNLCKNVFIQIHYPTFLIHMYNNSHENLICLSLHD